MGYQSLYRRYRSQNFQQLVGQDTTKFALKTAVAEGRHSHAYLFSGPRGTGKTSTARILAKALNCQNLTDGEPCTVCDSCTQIEAGTSFDLHELDAASNNKVDDVRDLIAKVALGSPGRTKVYILDEVHMLTSGAENALLKTLEEPPAHVVFVLATTEPHKVVSTIKSRTQHFEFNLIGAEDLEKHIRWVAEDADLSITDEGFAYALRKGGGSARDTLSALDLVAAAGGVPRDSNIGVDIAKAIGAADSAATIRLVQRGLETGREPRTIGEDALAVLRNGFLASMGAELDHLAEADTEAAKSLASAVGPAVLTRSLEVLGKALVDMRQAADPRVPLEVALLNLARRDGNDMSALLARVEALEAQLAGGAMPTPPPQARPPAPASPPATAGAPTQPAAPVADTQAQNPAAQTEVQARAPGPAAKDSAPAPPSKRPPVPRAAPQAVPQAAPSADPAAERSAGEPSGANIARARLAEVKASPTPRTQNRRQAQEPAPSAPVQAPAPRSDSPVGLEALQAVLADGLLESLSQKARARFRAGKFTQIVGDTATFALPNQTAASRSAEVKGDVEAALSNRLGRDISIEIVVDAGNGPPPEMTESAPKPKVISDEPEEVVDVTELKDANDVASNSIDRLTQAFPGAKVVENGGN